MVTFIITDPYTLTTYGLTAGVGKKKEVPHSRIRREGQESLVCSKVRYVCMCIQNVLTITLFWQWSWFQIVLMEQLVPTMDKPLTPIPTRVELPKTIPSVVEVPKPKHPVVQLPKPPTLRTPAVEIPKKDTGTLHPPKPVPPDSHMFMKKITRESTTTLHKMDTPSLPVHESMLWWWWNLFSESDVSIYIMIIMFITMYLWSLYSL